MLDRTLIPHAYSLSDFQLRTSKIVRLENQVYCLIVSGDLHPICFIELIFKSGGWFEHQAGTAYMTGKMLLGGTLNKTAEEVSVAYETLGSHIEIHTSVDYSSIKLYTTKKHLGQSLNLLEELLCSPSFPLEEFNINKSIKAQLIKSQLAKNPYFASIEFNKLLFGNVHPYGKSLDVFAIEQCTLDETVNFFNTKFTNEPKLILGGAIGNKEMDQINQILNKLTIFQHATPQFALNTNSQHHVIEGQASTQASLRLGGITINRSHSDIHKLNIAVKLLGGFFGSRLMKKIREEKGLTYGIHAAISHAGNSSYWSISSELKREKSAEALNEIHGAINELAHNYPSNSETEMLKNFLRGKFLGSMNTILDVTSVYSSLFINNLAEDFLKDYLNTLNTIHSRDISEMIQKYVLSAPTTSLMML